MNVNEIYLWYGTQALGICCLLWIAYSCHRMAGSLEKIHITKE